MFLKCEIDVRSPLVDVLNKRGTSCTTRFDHPLNNFNSFSDGPYVLCFLHKYVLAGSGT